MAPRRGGFVGSAFLVAALLPALGAGPDPDGSFGGSVRETSLGLLALMADPAGGREAEIAAATGWLTDRQDPDGRYGYDLDQPLAALALATACARPADAPPREAASKAFDALTRAGPFHDAAAGAWSLLACRAAMAARLPGAEEFLVLAMEDPAALAVDDATTILALVYSGEDPRTSGPVREAATRIADLLLAAAAGRGIGEDPETISLLATALREAGGGEWRTVRRLLPDLSASEGGPR